MKCLTPDGVDEFGNTKWREKKKYSSLDDAILVAKKVNLDPSRPRKVIAYKCPHCHKYHIGRGLKKMKESDREKILKSIKLERGLK